MTIRRFDTILAEHPLFRGFDADTVALFAGCAKNEHFAPGARIYAEGAMADRFYILTHGDVALEIASPGRGALIVETLHPGDLFGWAWLMAPGTHANDATALTEVRAISLDAACLRRKCAADPALGYRMFQEWVPHLMARLRALRLQLLDLYGVD
jgi:CRP-like cAMP-binding protein